MTRFAERCGLPPSIKISSGELVSVSADSLLSELRALDIRLSVEGDRLHCSAPMGRLTRELGERIAAHKAELILALQNSESRKASIPRRSAPTAPAALSFAQERFWFLQAFEPDATAYNITAFRHIEAHVEPTVMEGALRAVVKRHEILRTTFPEVDGFPTQAVHDDKCPDLAFQDLSSLNPAERTAALDDLVSTLAGKRFDLASGPLLEIALVRISDDEHCLVLTMHHIICDAWSIGIFFTELMHFYETLRTSDKLQPIPPPIQYSDYSQWERDRYASGTLLPQIEYWKSKLRGAPRHLDLPLDYPRPASLAYEGRLHRFEFSAATSELITQIARQQGVTLFMALLAVFKALLSRYTQQHDVVVGTAVSTRTQSELEQLIGCFINTHVLRTEIAQGATTKDLLAQVRTTVLESLDHAEIPFEILVNEVMTERDLSRSPLFQVAFILQNTPAASEYTVLSGGTTFDMTLYMWHSNGIIGGTVEYNATLFRPETIACFADCLATLANEMGAQPDVPIEQLRLLTNLQQSTWFDSCNGPVAAVPALSTHEWISQMATETPEAVAVVSGQEQLSFRQLEERSNRLAHRIRDLGVGPGSLVAICLDRTADLIVAPLAAWKAGAAYVPLDPEFPSSRLAFMLEDSAASVLITDSRLLDKLPTGFPGLICVDRDQQLLEQETSEAPASMNAPDNLAYVLYTSGSTGKPKGVEVSHHALVNFLASMQREPGIGRSDRLLAVTTFAFDIAGLELYLPLVSGARVVIAPRETTFDGTALSRLLETAGITMMQATPVTWRLLLESGWKGTAGLKILCGGEALPRELAEQLIATGAEVWNLYGPTETTIWSTLQRVVAHDGRFSIGRPIANTQVHVLDEFRHPVPIGIPAELYIGGDGLARGYLGRKQLTADRFIDNPFQTGEKLYRTGDLVRRLADGSLEYRGRVDHQVKLRGFRIELGEIEAVLEQQPGISQAVVVLREDTSGDPQLTAYLRGPEPLRMESHALRNALLATLPEYMLPSSFVQLDAFPLTPNRKVDRKALLSPKYQPRKNTDALTSQDAADQTGQSPTDKSLSNRYVAPSNPVERLMAEIWQEVLNVPRVSMLDNFFELGGHSLSAARLVSKLRSAMDMDLPLRCIFLHPTISELSSHIAYDAAGQTYRYASELPKWSCLVPVQPKGTRRPLFLVAGYANPDETLLELSQLIPHFGTDQPIFGFRPRWVEGNDGYATVDEMAREFLAELRKVQPKGPYQLGGHCVGGIAALEVAQLLLQEGEEVKLMVLLDTERPTAWRTFLADLYFMRQRTSHILDVLSEILHARGRTRSQMIRKLIHRKLKQTDQFYKAKVDYRRMLYSHTPKDYAGRITLIVNEEQARVERDLGWTSVAHNGLDIYTIPGAHFTVMDLHAGEVAQAIMQSMASGDSGSFDGKIDPVQADAL